MAKYKLLRYPSQEEKVKHNQGVKNYIKEGFQYFGEKLIRESILLFSKILFKGNQ